MTYPPKWRSNSDPALAAKLMSEHPFAHLITSHAGLQSTRIPVVTDLKGGRPVRVRGHINGQNPQAKGLDGNEVLVVFSGYSTYVSPQWRVDQSRGGTYDYEQVSVRGKARVIEGIEPFCRLIDDLSSLIEPQYAEVGDYPVWQTSMAAPGYIEHFVSHITQFEIEIEELEVVSKLHQEFPEEDRRSVAEHLQRCDRDGARAIAERIRSTL
jgi:transcriptional regulator